MGYIMAIIWLLSSAHHVQYCLSPFSSLSLVYKRDKRQLECFSSIVSHKTLPKMKQEDMECCLVFYRDFTWSFLAYDLSDFVTTHFPHRRASGAAQQLLAPSDYCHQLNNCPRLAILNIPVPTSCPLVCPYHPHFRRWYQSDLLPAHTSPSCSTGSVEQ
jgi:hypothetical protein